MDTIFKSGLGSLPGAPIGIPFGAPTQNLIKRDNKNYEQRNRKPEDTLPRAINYLADYGGCGFYRCMAPNLLLNLNQKAIVTESSTMLFEPRLYRACKAVKFQRQGTTSQTLFMKELYEFKKEAGFKIIYEIDDVVFAEDIPLYNRNRGAFANAEVQKNIRQILNYVDEVVVTTEYFKEYFKSKTGLTNVSSVPNYLMKWWFDRYYNLGDLIKKYEKNKKKPKISIFASGTHVDGLNAVNQQDDFETILPYIIKTRNEYEWSFYGCLPFGLRDYVGAGQIKYTPWCDITSFAEMMHKSDSQLTFAALRDNEFNKCKSNIKLIESGALGIPCVCPDLPPYKEALLKYKTGSEFIDQIKSSLKNQTVYADLCKKSRALAEMYWLDDNSNLMKHHEIYFTPFGSNRREFLV